MLRLRARNGGHVWFVRFTWLRVLGPRNNSNKNKFSQNKIGPWHARREKIYQFSKNLEIL